MSKRCKLCYADAVHRVFVKCTDDTVQVRFCDRHFQDFIVKNHGEGQDFHGLVKLPNAGES